MHTLFQQIQKSYTAAQRILDANHSFGANPSNDEASLRGLMLPFEQSIRHAFQEFMQPPSCFDDLRIHTFYREDKLLFPISVPQVPKQSLEDICQDEYRSLMRRLAALADALALPPLRIPCFLEECFARDEEGQIYAAWPYLAGLRLANGQTQLKPHQRAFRHLMHPQLSRQLPDDLDSYLPSAMCYSFVLFFLRQLHPMAEQWVHQKALDRLRALLPWLPPALPALLQHVTSTERSHQEQGATTRFWKQVEEIFLQDLHLQKHSSFCDLEIEKESYQVSGRLKAGPLQDAELCVSPIPNAFWMGGVADGVSTADLGSGEEAAREVARCFSVLGATSMPLLAQPTAWPIAVSDFWATFAKQAHTAIAQRCEELRASHLAPETIQDPMSSTFVAAMILGDRASIAWLGDSPAWHYRAGEGRLIRLTVEDSQLYERLRAGEWDALSTPTDGDNHLSRFLGMAYPSEQETNTSLDLMKPHQLFVQLQEGDILLLASDGLLCGIGGLSPFVQDQKLEQKIKECLQQDPSLRRLVLFLVQEADQYGDDNISLIAVRVSKLNPLTQSDTSPSSEPKSPMPASDPSDTIEATPSFSSSQTGRASSAPSLSQASDVPVLKKKSRNNR
ncbi:protein phosphatase 2C domain-containing protein [Myxococcota bacterium]|nr:protein phosphatase 2C domain-containing protein [Myxococcota bacterium]